MLMDNITQYVKGILLEVEGQTSDREGLRETPKRVQKMYQEVFNGYDMNPKEILSKTFESDSSYNPDNPYKQNMVIVKDIDFTSFCEHHMLPFFGKVHIGYIPTGRVVGLSKLARLTECFAHRLQIQERLTDQIADAIYAELKPQGVMVVVNAVHTCMKIRGVKNATSNTTTSTVRGVFTDPTVRSEFLSLIGGSL